MQLHKTDRARAELKPGTRTLGQRERTLLLMADGSRSAQDFGSLFDGLGEQLALRLLREGFLAGHPGQPQQKTATPATLPPHAAVQPHDATGSEGVQIIKLGADTFEGKRSLATTRMFLFDICERMFARRSPLLAESYREGLRLAKDRASMLAVAREMMREIEKIAGPERADSISERLAMLLPVESAQQKLMTQAA